MSEKSPSILEQKVKFHAHPKNACTGIFKLKVFLGLISEAGGNMVRKYIYIFYKTNEKQTT